MLPEFSVRHPACSLGVFRIHETTTHFSRLIEKAANGASFVIAKSGKPMVTVSVSMPPPDPVKRSGFLKGGIAVPVDVDAMGREEVQGMFHGAK